MSTTTPPTARQLIDALNERGPLLEKPVIQELLESRSADTKPALRLIGGEEHRSEPDVWEQLRIATERLQATNGRKPRGRPKLRLV